MTQHPQASGGVTYTKMVDESFDEEVIQDSFQRLGVNSHSVPAPETLHNYLLQRRHEQQEGGAHRRPPKEEEDGEGRYHDRGEDEERYEEVTEEELDEYEEHSRAAAGTRKTDPSHSTAPSSRTGSHHRSSRDRDGHQHYLPNDPVNQYYSYPLPRSRVEEASGLVREHPSEADLQGYPQSSNGVVLESLYLQRKKLQAQREAEEETNRQFLRDIRALKSRLDGKPHRFEEETYSSRQHHGHIDHRRQSDGNRPENALLQGRGDNEDCFEDENGRIPPKWRRAEAVAFERKRRELLAEYGAVAKAEQEEVTHLQSQLEGFEPPTNEERFGCKKLAWNRYERVEKLEKKSKKVHGDLIDTSTTRVKQAPGRFESTGRYVSLHQLEVEEERNRRQHEAKRLGFISTTRPSSKGRPSASRVNTARPASANHNPAARNRKMCQMWKDAQQKADRRGRDAVWEYRVAHERTVGGSTRRV